MNTYLRKLHNTFLVLSLVIISLGYHSSAQAADPIILEFDTIRPVPEAWRPLAETYFSADGVSIPAYDSFTASSYIVSNTDDNWGYLLFVPSYIPESGWNEALNPADIVEFVLYRENGFWTIYRVGEVDLLSIQENIPADLGQFDVAGEEVSTAAGPYYYAFPWATSVVWKKTRGPGWHNGYAIDFAPTTSNQNVYAVSNGYLRQTCNDGYQAQFTISHPQGSVDYLHLHTSNLQTQLVNTNVTVGRHLGRVYNGTRNIYPVGNACDNYSGLAYRTPCGCGTGPHLHLDFHANPGNNVLFCGAHGAYNVAHTNSGTSFTCYRGTGKPGAPTITSPSNGANINGTSVNIAVSQGALNYTGKANYAFEISRNSAFTDIVWSQTWTTDRTHTANLSNGNYWLRVYQGDTVSQAGERIHSFTVSTTADLSATISNVSPAQPVSGSTFSFTARATNNGPSSSTNTTLTIDLGTGVTPTSAPGCSAVGSVLTCNVGTVNSGSNKTVNIVALVPPDKTGSVNLSATVSGDRTDSNANNNTATLGLTTTQNADLAITDVGTTSVTATENATVTVEATNNGPSTANAITLTLPTPDGFTVSSSNLPGGNCVLQSGDVVCTVAAMQPNDSATLTVVYTTGPGTVGTIPLTATISSNTNDDTSGNDSGTGDQVITDRSACAKADVNGSGSVNIIDVRAVGLAFNTTPGHAEYNLYRDMDRNGVVNILDLRQVALHFGMTCAE